MRKLLILLFIVIYTNLFAGDLKLNNFILYPTIEKTKFIYKERIFNILSEDALIEGSLLIEYFDISDSIKKSEALIDFEKYFQKLLLTREDII